LSISITPIIFSTVSNLKNTYGNKELFNIELSRFKSIEDITAHIDGIYSATHPSLEIDTLAYVKATSDIVKKRFYHGLSGYSIKDNWITYLGGKFLWSHLTAIVEPDDILDYTEGLCSQQTIVFLEILKRKGIKTRWIGLGYKEGPGHFLAEVQYQGKWHLYDVNLEPKWERVTNHHESIAYYKQYPDTLFLAYEGIISRNLFDKIMEKVQYGEVNEFPAKNMLLFHRITKIVTYLIPVFLGIIILITLFKQKVPSKIIQKTASKLKSKEKELIE
jgi:hypothetical protein